MFGEDQAELPFIYAYIGLWYYELANFTMALKWILRSLEMLQNFNEESMLEVLKNPRQCVIAFKLAACYERTNDLNKALQFYLQAAINNEENFGLSDQKTKAAMRKARELAEDLNRQSDLPDWMTSN
jgi:tetratricopeptide (TPR) repeat protein